MDIDNKQVSPCLGPGLVCFFSQKLKECTGLYIKYINLTYYVSVLEDCSAELRDKAQTALIDIISESVKQLTLPEAEKANIKSVLSN